MQFIYQFPHFNLLITHDENSILGSRFVKPNSYVDNLELSTQMTNFTRQIINELDSYCINQAHQFNLPLQYTGSYYQLKVWQIISEIKPGTTLTYKDIAKLIKSAPRAIGGACANNPLPIFIPCHRVIAVNGHLGGFNSGNIFFNLNIKKWLLKHEGIKLNSA